jgi:hypothetical protein
MSSHPDALTPILSVLRAPPLPRMSWHDPLDRDLIEALQKNDVPASLRALFKGASLSAWMPQHKRTIRDHLVEGDQTSHMSRRIIHQFEELLEATRSSDFDWLSWKSSKGFKAIHLFNIANHSEGFLALLQAGEDPHAECGVHRTPLSYAAEHNALEVIVELMTLPSSAHRLSEGHTEKSSPLHWAIMRGHPRAAQVLLECGANPNAEDGSGWTPLKSAATQNRMDLCSLLIKHGAQVHLVTKDGKTAVDWAESMGYTELASELLACERAWDASKSIDQVMARASLDMAHKRP